MSLSLFDSKVAKVASYFTLILINLGTLVLNHFRVPIKRTFVFEFKVNISSVNWLFETATVVAWKGFSKLQAYEISHSLELMMRINVCHLRIDGEKIHHLYLLITSCFMLQYFTFSVMLVMIGCAVFLQLSTVHKFSMLALMSAVFVVLLRVVYKDLFNNHDKIHFCWWVLSLKHWQVLLYDFGIEERC